MIALIIGGNRQFWAEFDSVLAEYWTNIMGKRTVYLVRHGQYKLHQRDEGGLTQKGEAQSKHTAAALAKIPFATVYFSPVLRAVQTAQIITEKQPQAECIQQEALRECIPSIPQRYAAYFAGSHPDLRMDHVNDCADKLDSAFGYFFRPYDGESDIHDLLVCHGNVIRYFISRVLNMGDDGWSHMLINNCGICRVLIDIDGQMYLVSHNDIGHLAEDLRTDN